MKDKVLSKFFRSLTVRNETQKINEIYDFFTVFIRKTALIWNQFQFALLFYSMKNLHGTSKAQNIDSK